MAEAIVGKIEEKLLDKIWDYTVAQIAKQFRYVFFFNGNIEELKTQLEKLQLITQGVQVRVDADDVQLKVTAPHVKDWLKSANDVEREVEEIIKEKLEVKKGCLNGWCPNLKLRYSLSRKAVKKNKVIVDLQEEGKQYVKQSCSPPPPSMKPIPNEDYTVFESRSLDMEKIIKALKEDKFNLIGIHGLPGVGKTTIAKEVAKRAIEYGLFVEVVWADVKREPELTDVQAHIGNMLGLDEFGKDASLKARACRLRERLLQDKKILVILDDIWKEFDVHDMGLPLGGANKNFKILYTSRFRGLWHDKKTIKFEIPLQLLSNEEARKLFKKQVGDCADTSDLQPIAEEIVNACRRLPLALVLIGKALSNESSGNSTKYMWKDMQRRLTCSRSTPEDMDWSSTLEPSYQAVEHEETKRLFLLCCLFDKGKSIPVEVLVRYALGFSLFPDQIEGMSNVRARVFTLVADLERRYLLLDDPSKSDHKHVNVHDLVHDMGVSIASKYKGALGSHGTISEYPKKDDYDRYALVSHGAVSKWPNKDKFQHYTSISVILEEITELPEELTCPNLEFLLLKCRKLENLSCHFFKGMGKLKVLELYEYPGIIPTLQPLTNLTVLSLNGLYRGDPDYVPVIEPVIGYLLNLEILSFLNLGIKKLPEEIGKLVKLRLLDLTRTFRLETIPPLVISRLVRLEELYMLGSKFSYWEGEGEEKGINANLREFEHLSNLNTLEISIRSGVVIPKVAMLFSKLKKYKVVIKSTDNIWYYRGMQYERELLVGTWLGRDIRADHGGLDLLLRSSDSISLRNNDLVLLQDNDLVRLQDGVDRLQQLKFLEIESCKTPKCLVITMNRVQQPPYAVVTAIFPILEKLRLRDVDGLREICHGPIPTGSFGHLTKIQIYDCNSLKYLFPLPIVECLTKLISLAICRCALMEEVIWKEQPEDVHIATNNRIEFPMLESLSLEALPSLLGFCRGIDEINFPRLKDLFLYDLSKLEHIVHGNSNLSTNSKPNNNVGSLSLFPQMVTFPSLEKLVLHELQNVSNVFYPSLVAVFVNLQTLIINNCSKMETIVDWEEGKEREIPKTLFPQLMNLELKSLPCLMRFRNFTHPIELPLLSKIDISGCRSMTAFCSGPVSAPNFYFQGVSGNIDDAIKFMQKEDQRMKEEQRKEEERRKEEAEEMAKGKGWPMKVKYEFHEHDLELIQRLMYTCDGCEEGGKDWSFYCKDCDFDLHPKCALEENKATKGNNEGGLEEGATTKGWPKKVKHKLHEHELEQILRLVDYICDGCEEGGKGWSFYCKYCDFGLHRKCALEQNKETKGDKEDGLEEGATTKEGWVCN